MVQIGIVGVGFMGMIHFLASRNLRGGRVAAICSRDEGKLAGDWRSIRGNFGPVGAMTDLTGVKKYRQLDDFLGDEAIDLVNICSPTDQHPQAVLHPEGRQACPGRKAHCPQPEGCRGHGSGGSASGQAAYGGPYCAFLSRVRLPQCRDWRPPFRQAARGPFQAHHLSSRLVCHKRRHGPHGRPGC